ncbi:MAG TPA: LamG-like jellyroll fold domain-containing protein, partial [Candidatus Tectomicrobia bacterium]
STAVEASGNGTNGVLTNGPVFVAGKYGNGVRLDGGNDYVNLGNPASLQLTGSMTLSAWINSSAFPMDDAAIISKRQSSRTGYQLDTTIDTGPRTLGFKISDALGNTVARYGATTLTLRVFAPHIFQELLIRGSREKGWQKSACTTLPTPSPWNPTKAP